MHFRKTSGRLYQPVTSINRYQKSFHGSGRLDKTIFIKGYIMIFNELRYAVNNSWIWFCSCNSKLWLQIPRTIHGPSQISAEDGYATQKYSELQLKKLVEILNRSKAVKDCFLIRITSLVGQLLLYMFWFRLIWKSISLCFDFYKISVL